MDFKFTAPLNIVEFFDLPAVALEYHKIMITINIPEYNKK